MRELMEQNMRARDILLQKLQPPIHDSDDDDDSTDGFAEDVLVQVDGAAPNGTSKSTKKASKASNGKVDAAVTHPPLEPQERGMAVGCKELYSGKEDRKGRFTWQTEIPKNLGKPAEDAESEKWAIIVRRTRVYNDPKKVLSLHSIVVQSPLIRQILEKVLDGYPGVTAALKRLEFSGRFEPLVHRWPRLREAIAHLNKRRDEGDTSVGELIEHAELLGDLLAEEFSEIMEAMGDMQENGVVTFQHMWTIFQPSDLVFTRTDGQDRVLRLLNSAYGIDRDQQPVFWLTCIYVDFDGQRFGTQKLNLKIPSFEGTKSVNSLPAFPLSFHDQHEQLQAKLTERGAKVEALAGSHFRNYNGIGWRINMQTGLKEKHTVKGRIVVDSFGYNRFQPDYAVYVTPLNAPDETAPGLRSHGRMTLRATGAGISDKFGLPSFVNTAFNLDHGDDESGMPSDGFFDDEDHGKRPALTAEQRLMCTPMVRGYALKEKQWLNFFVNAVSVCLVLIFYYSLIFPLKSLTQPYRTSLSTNARSPASTCQRTRRT